MILDLSLRKARLQKSNLVIAILNAQFRVKRKATRYRLRVSVAAA